MTDRTGTEGKNGGQLKTAVWTPPQAGGANLIPFDDIRPTLGLDDPYLTWHDGIDEPIDPFGLENEFKETSPLQQPATDTEHDSDRESDKRESPPEHLSRTEKRAWKATRKNCGRRSNAASTLPSIKTRTAKSSGIFARVSRARRGGHGRRC